MPAWIINRESVSSELMEGEVVAINLVTGIYYSLRGTAADLWQALAAPVSGATLAGVLAGKYQVTVEAAGRDVEEFLNRLLAEQLVIKTEAPAMESVPGPGSEAAPYAPPQLERFADLQDLLLLDPIHDVGAQGWPHVPPPEKKG